jgi:D-isomer specific 2-hydroxyacid dehydrogenase-like protein
VGLGNIGGQVARIGLAFGMKIIAWSENMTPEIAEAAGAAVAAARELLIGNAIGGSAKGNINEFRVVRDPTQATATT